MLTADQTFGALDSTQIITATRAGLNVVDASSVNLQGGETITFAGNPGDFLVVRVSDTVILGDLITGGNSKISAGSLGPSGLLFVVGGDITKSGGVHDGTYISAAGNITLSGGVHNGACIVVGAERELESQSAPTVNHVEFVPEPSTALLVGLGLLLRALARR